MTELSCSLSIIGDGSVGKSTIINAFRSDGFQPIYKQTIGMKKFLIYNSIGLILFLLLFLYYHRL